MTKATNGERLYRYNLVLADAESAWLDELAEEIQAATGAKVSRSEIVRAAIAGLRELHRLAPECRFPPMTAAKNGADLAMLTVLAARCAAQEKP